MTKEKQVNSNLIRKLAEEGYRIFTIDQAREFAPEAGLSQAYLPEALHYLTKSGWLVRLKKGLYTLSGAVPGVSPVHEFEIAMVLTDPAAISHWSAFSYHGLTDQVPQTVFVLTTTGSTIPRVRNSQNKNSGYPICGIDYRFVQTKPERFFGVEQVWIEEARIMITDMERTLLDGLSMPRYCGDFGEVLHAFNSKAEEINVERIIEYALKLDASVGKRLGWVLEKQGVEPDRLEALAEISVKGYRQLDPSGPRKGSCNSRWMIQENLYQQGEA